MKKGISLVALVITIIVLIILAATIMIMFNQGGIFSKAEEATFKSDFSNILDSFMIKKNGIMLEKLSNANIEDTKNEDEIKENIPLLKNNNKSINGHTYASLIQIHDSKIYQSYTIAKSNEEKDKEISRWLQEIGIEILDETISSEDKFIGCYADIDADGEVDGIIYADLLHGKSGKKFDGNGYVRLSFDYTNISNELMDVKDYYIIQENYEGPFGIADVISPIGSGNKRFYVMALSNIPDKGYGYEWYHNNDVENTSSLFGMGQKNTEDIKQNFQVKEYNNPHKISLAENMPEGWFIPSLGEWAAFYYNLEDKDVYTKMRDEFWTSSKFKSSNDAIYMTIIVNGTSTVGASEGVNRKMRLSTTF